MGRINRNSSRGGNTNNSGGGSRSFGNRGGNNTNSNNGKSSDFLRIGSVTVAKTTQNALGVEIVDDLRELNASLVGEIYLPEGQNAVTLEHGTKVLIRLNEVKNAPDYVVGTLNLIKSNSN